MCGWIGKLFFVYSISIYSKKINRHLYYSVLFLPPTPFILSCQKNPGRKIWFTLSPQLLSNSNTHKSDLPNTALFPCPPSEFPSGLQIHHIISTTNHLLSTIIHTFVIYIFPTYLWSCLNTPPHCNTSPLKNFRASTYHLHKRLDSFIILFTLYSFLFSPFCCAYLYPAPISPLDYQHLPNPTLTAAQRHKLHPFLHFSHALTMYKYTSIRHSIPKNYVP